MPDTTAIPRNEHPVTAVGPDILRVETRRGAGDVPFYRSMSDDDSRDVSQVVIVLHGRLRDADAYMAAARQALSAAETDPSRVLLIVPQFLASADVGARGLSADTLHWEWTAWMGGDDAIGPAPLSSFDVLDTFVQQFSDTTRYPALKEIVIAGHSGGAQVAHRYAIVGAQPAIRMRFVIANPSSYVYFDALRPDAGGMFRPADTLSCPGVDDWKYGVNRLPRYAQSMDAARLETRYIARSVTYLLGQKDCDPSHEALDRSCAARAQGPHRLARGRAYFAYLRARHPDLRHACTEVENVGHDGGAMLGSPAGVTALFGVPRRATAVESSPSGAMD